MNVIAASGKTETDFLLVMANDAIAYHEADENGVRCCTAENPCTARRNVQTQMDLTQGRIGSTSVNGREIETERPARPAGSGSGHGSAPVKRAASEKQTALIGRLAEERDLADLAPRLRRTLDQIQAGSAVESRAASDLITALLDLPRPARTEIRTLAPAKATISADLADGMYRTPDGEIYKIQTAIYGSGRIYAKKLVELAEPRELKKGVRTHEFAYEAGALRKLTAEMRMTADEAAEWGKLYGTCCRCGLALTDEKSIDRGLGPICKDKI
jgi:hypothetical protein